MRFSTDMTTTAKIHPHPDRPEALLLTIPETAARLGISRSTTYELIAQGDLETVHIGRSVRVPNAAIDEFVHRLRQR